ncbi:MAG TPA: LUD domain-containing protein [Marmoricola sp.]|nr:LUD domain-containing protein [Marmoricola sp.]
MSAQAGAGAREEVLARIRRATADRAQQPVEVPRGYRRAGEAGEGEVDQHQLLDQLVDRLVDYKAGVHRCAPGEVARTVARVLEAHRAVDVVVPDGFPDADLPPGLAPRRDDPALSPAQLDGTDGVLTTCAVAVAETGTIVLDAGPGQGRRALTLVPDLHVVVVRADQVVRGVPEALTRLTPTRPLTWISGPSATSDIELDRVEGVHGPRRLEVVLVDGMSHDES